MSEQNIDRIRREALDQADKRKRASNWLLVGAATVEGLGLLLYLVLMDFSDRLHWLIFIAAGLVYGTLALAMFSQGEETKAAFHRVLRAIEELRCVDAERPAGQA